MDISINIRAASPEDYKAALKALNEGTGYAAIDLGDIPAPAPQAAPVEAPVPAAEELPIPTEKPARKPRKAATKPAEAATWTPGGGIPEQEEAKPVPTIADLQAAGRKLALAGGQDKLVKILDKYGVTNIMALPAEHRAAFLTDLEAANG